jgi:hypothetical protein
MYIRTDCTLSVHVASVVFGPLRVIRAHSTEAQGNVGVDASWVLVGEGRAYTPHAGCGAPYAERHLMQVGASDSADIRSSFSNWGSCLDMYASC